MNDRRDDVCGCGCGFRSSNQPLLKLAEMVHKAEAKAKADEQRKAVDTASANEQRERAAL